MPRWPAGRAARRWNSGPRHRLTRLGMSPYTLHIMKTHSTLRDDNTTFATQSYYWWLSPPA